MPREHVERGTVPAVLRRSREREAEAPEHGAGSRVRNVRRRPDLGTPERPEREPARRGRGLGGEALAPVIAALNDKHVTHAALKTIAAFLNTEGGDLLISVDDDRQVLGIEHDRLENDDQFMRHLTQAVRNGLGDRAGTCIDRAG